MSGGGFRETDAVLERWRAADAADPSPSATASWAWNRAWVDHYGKTVEVRIAEEITTRAESVSFLLTPLSGNRPLGPIPLRTLHLGTAGEPHGDGVFAEYVRPWVAASRDEAACFSDAVTSAVAFSGADRIDLDGVSDGLLSAVTFDEAVLPGPATIPRADIERRPSPWHDTSHGDPDRVLSALGSSTRRNLKRRLKSYPGLRAEWAADAETGLRFLDELIPMHQARWTAAGKPGAFASPRFEGFCRDLIRLSDGDERVIVSRICDDAGTVGCVLLLAQDGRVCDFTAGFASPEERPSPGLVAHYANICEAARRGRAGYEFLVGDARVKRDLATGERTLCWAKVPLPTARMRLATAAKRVVRAVRPLKTRGAA